MADQEFTPELSDEQVAFFRQNGYLAIDRITNDAEVSSLVEIYDQIFDKRSGEDRGWYFDLAGPKGHDGKDVLPQVLAPEAQIPELRSTTYHRNAIRLASRLLGIDKPESWFGHMILKPPRFGRETPWHQDEAYWDPSHSHESLSVWMPLEAATVESGCMQFVPGTHAYQVERHRHIDGDPRVHGLEIDKTQTPDGAVACPVPAGGATFHHCRILHYAGPNTTDRPRRAWITVVHAPKRKLDEPAERPWLQRA